MHKSPAFSFYAKDWLDIRVLRMSYESQGVYIRLLAHMWADSPDQCSIQSDTESLSRVLGLPPARLRRVMDEIQDPDDPIFLCEAGRYVSKRLRLEKEKQVENSEKRSKAGQQGAKGRWQTHDSAIPLAIGLPSSEDGLSSSSSPSLPPEAPPRGGAAAPEVVDARTQAADPRLQDLALCLEAAKPFKMPRDGAKARAFDDLFRQGVEAPKIVAALAANPKAKFYAVVDLLSNGRADVPFKASPASLRQDSEPLERERRRIEACNRAREEADRRLAETPADELEAWRREVAEEAKRQGWTSFLNESSMKTGLRLRAAKKYGIGGL